MFCKYCRYEFYVPGETLGAKVRCPNCTVTLRVEDKQLLYPCPKCSGMLDVALWMVGSTVSCPHCKEEITLTLGEDSRKYFPDSPKQTALLNTASRKAGDIIGKYRVIRCLGVGGMGEVYLAEHTLLNTRCALKLLKSDIAKSDPEMRARLLREARLASQIQHKNLIAVLDAELDENSDSCYIVMEYVDGVSIEHIIADTPMLEERAIEIIVNVVEALKEAAAHKIIHRDIKPANIMLSSTGTVKLADLGIAKVESDNKNNMTLTMDNAVLGTPNYASPEQLRSSHKVDSRADIYSLGATLYHMLTGKRPFESESVFGVMANVLEKDLPLANTINPEVSQKTAQLIARMMAKKRDERPENFDVLLAELSEKSKRFKLPKFDFKKVRKYVTFKNIWSAFLGIVAVAGLCVAGKILYNNQKSSENDSANEHNSRYVYRRMSFRKNSPARVVRQHGTQSNYGSDRRKTVVSNTPENSSTVTPVAKTSSDRNRINEVDVPEKSGNTETQAEVNSQPEVVTQTKTQSEFNDKQEEAELIFALYALDIRRIKAIHKHSQSQLSAKTLEFVRSVIRMNYPKCKEIADSIDNADALKEKMNGWCKKVLSTWFLPLRMLRIDNRSSDQIAIIERVLNKVKTFDIQNSYELNIIRRSESMLKSADRTRQSSRSRGGWLVSTTACGFVAVEYLKEKEGEEFFKKDRFAPTLLHRRCEILARNSVAERSHVGVLQQLSSVVALIEAGVPITQRTHELLKQIPAFDDFIDNPISSAPSATAPSATAPSVNNNNTEDNKYSDEKRDFKQQLFLLKKAHSDGKKQEAEDLAVLLSKEVYNQLVRLIAQSNYKRCGELIEQCYSSARVSKSESIWQDISVLLQDEYVKKMKASENHAIAKIFPIWRTVDRVRANNVHNMYSAFERAFLRLRFREAKDILKRHVRFSSKYIEPLQARLETAKKEYQDNLLRDFNSAINMRRPWVDDIVDEMESADCEHRVITNSKKIARKTHFVRIKRSVMRMFLADAAWLSQPWLAKLALESGASHHDKFTKFRTDSTIWKYLIERKHLTNDRRYTVAIILHIADKKRLAEFEKRAACGFNEIAEFILEK